MVGPLVLRSWNRGRLVTTRQSLNVEHSDKVGRSADWIDTFERRMESCCESRRIVLVSVVASPRRGRTDYFGICPKCFIRIPLSVLSNVISRSDLNWQHSLSS